MPGIDDAGGTQLAEHWNLLPIWRPRTSFMLSHNRPPEPWDSLFRDLASALSAPLRLDCIGGFVVTQLYGFDRTTADIDVIELAPRAGRTVHTAPKYP